MVFLRHSTIADDRLREQIHFSNSLIYKIKPLSILIPELGLEDVHIRPIVVFLSKQPMRQRMD